MPVDRKSGKRALESVGERTDRWAATGSPNWTIDSVIVGGRWVSSDARLAVRTWPRLSAPSSPLGSPYLSFLSCILTMSVRDSQSPLCPRVYRPSHGEGSAVGPKYSASRLPFVIGSALINSYYPACVRFLDSRHHSHFNCDLASLINETAEGRAMFYGRTTNSGIHTRRNK